VVTRRPLHLVRTLDHQPPSAHGNVRRPDDRGAADRRAGRQTIPLEGPASTPQVVDVFPGGCVTYQPEPDIGPSAPLLDQAQRAVTYRTRDDLREALRRNSGGRLRLDPEASNQHHSRPRTSASEITR
jgi:hypothetical protein